MLSYLEKYARHFGVVGEHGGVVEFDRTVIKVCEMERGHTAVTANGDARGKSCIGVAILVLVGAYWARGAYQVQSCQPILAMQVEKKEGEKKWRVTTMKTVRDYEEQVCRLCAFLPCTCPRIRMSLKAL